MKHNIITLALAIALSACGSGNDSSGTNQDGDKGNSGSGTTINTPAQISGAQSETIFNNGTSVTGTLSITDDNDGEAAFNTTTTGAKYGSLSITPAGDWTYIINKVNTDVDSLASGQSLTDTITVTSIDGTEATVNITIEHSGATVPSPTQISGTLNETIYHDGTSVTGTLSITADKDEEAAFNTTTSGVKYGTLTITSAGVWTYDLNKANNDVASLVLGQSLTDTITVTSIDGTQATVTIAIVHSGSASLIVPSLPSEILSVPPISCDQVFNDPGDLEDAVSEDMSAGTTLCMADGTYTDDFKIKFGGAGTKDAPIKVAAQNPGKVTFSGGEVKIQMGGSYAQLQGFIFEDNLSGSNFIETRFGTADLCHNCRITENTVVNAKAKSSGLVLAHIYGKNVWVDHNIFSGKTAENPMISINRWVDSKWTEEQILAELADGIVVYGNYIANRPPANGKMYANSGDNNYEAVRTGLSQTHHYPGNSIVAGNLFENIQGEAEVISNKGSNNVISGNTVRNSYGSITNRHGNTNVISNNFIFGDGFPYAGGLRIVDDGHTITNNYIEGARYQKTSHHGGIVIIGSDGDGDGENGYQQVENVHIAHNTVVNSVNSVNIDGGGKSKQPKQVYFANNIVDKAIGDVFVDTARGVSSDSKYAGNIVFGDSDLAETSDVSANVLGATFVSAMLEKAEDGLYRPSANSPSLTAVSYEKGDFADVDQDMDGTARGDVTEAGADDINSDTTASAPLTYGIVGPQSYDYPKPAAIMVETALSNADFEDGLTSWTGGTLINVSEGAFAGNSLFFSGSSTAMQSGITLTPNSKYAISAFVNGTYSLAVNDHVFEGDITSSSYTYVYHEFKTGPSETSGTITLKVADEVTTNAGLQDGNMYDFRSNDGKLGVWNTHENGLVDIRDASESAFSSGSARISFPDDVTQDFSFTPGLTQSITGVKTGVDLTYSLYYCDTKAEDDEISITTLHYGVKDVNGNVIAEARANESELDDAPRGTLEVCFKQVSLELPNNTESELEIFAFIEVDSSLSHAEIEAHQQFTKYDLRVYLDEFALTYQEAAASDAEAKIDEVRLVTRTIDELVK